MRLPLARLHAIALPLMRDNVDTDYLIPVAENTRISRTGWGDGLFATQRYKDGSARTPDPDFILNQPPYDRAKILVSGANFGCGSSRESAVWALRDYGFRVIAALSFNETFKRNCISNGLAPLVLQPSDAERLSKQIPARPLTGVAVDLEVGLLWVGTQNHPSRGIRFELDPFYTKLLIEGRTEGEILQATQEQIDQHSAKLRQTWPWLTSGNRPL